MENLVIEKFNQAREKVSDINEHIETFYQYTISNNCTHVTELGIRYVISSWGFLRGLLDLKEEDKTLISVDINDHPNIKELGDICAGVKVKHKFIQQDSAKVDLEPTDILFIDTWHIYGHLKRELAKHHSIVKKFIMMHDTTIDATIGEAVRDGQNITQMARRSGYPIQEITRGIWLAIEEFLADHPEWVIDKRYTNNNGLTILKRI